VPAIDGAMTGIKAPLRLAVAHPVSAVQVGVRDPGLRLGKLPLFRCQRCLATQIPVGADRSVQVFPAVGLRDMNGPISGCSSGSAAFLARHRTTS
jgi:hypothetical protein